MKSQIFLIFPCGRTQIRRNLRRSIAVTRKSNNPPARDTVMIMCMVCHPGDKTTQEIKNHPKISIPTKYPNPSTNSPETQKQRINDVSIISIQKPQQIRDMSYQQNPKKKFPKVKINQDTSNLDVKIQA